MHSLSSADLTQPWVAGQGSAEEGLPLMPLKGPDHESGARGGGAPTRLRDAESQQIAVRESGEQRHLQLLAHKGLRVALQPPRLGAQGRGQL